MQGLNGLQSPVWVGCGRVLHISAQIFQTGSRVLPQLGVGELASHEKRSK
jgi:hypothetical protein